LLVAQALQHRGVLLQVGEAARERRAARVVAGQQQQEDVVQNLGVCQPVVMVWFEEEERVCLSLSAYA
jgi:hypothetical protein